ncbi:hypothetical protein D9757_010665 [Collybiopsis confluens]|uniref:Uncharacterized protein n=1 Tax=Collybiopsis confluens TaxID=2823264 RepID=A0A8H5GMR5_9AGAR|nr:hypothetical protein D9757_010665 [Collybiopsis confluens]
MIHSLFNPSNPQVSMEHSNPPIFLLQAYGDEMEKLDPWFRKDKPIVPKDLAREDAPPIPEELVKYRALVYGLPLSDKAFENYDESSRGPRMRSLENTLHDLGISDAFRPSAIYCYSKRWEMELPVPVCMFTTALHIEAGVGQVPTEEKRKELCRRLNVDPIHLRWYRCRL